MTFREAEDVPARPRAVRDEVRPGADAQADDRARPAAAALRVDPRGRLQRQVVHRAVHRGDPRARGAAHRHATPRPTWRRSASGSRWGRSRCPRSASPTAVERTVGLVEDVTQFEALTAAAYHELAAREVEVAVIEAGLGGPLRRHQRDPVEAHRAHRRGAGAHALAGADDPRHRRREAGRGARPLGAGGAVRPAPRGAGGGRAGVVASATPASSPRRCPTGPFQRRNFSLAYVAAAEFLGRAPERRGGGGARSGRRASPAGSRSWPSARSRSTTAPTTRPAPRRSREALPELVGERRPAVLVASVLDDKDAAGMLGALLPGLRPRRVHALREPAGAVAGARSSRSRRSSAGPPSETVAGPAARPWRARGRSRARTGPWWPPGRST